MVALRPAVLFLERRLKLPKVLSTVLVYVTFMTLLFLSIGLIVPPLVSELQRLLDSQQIPLFQPIQDEIRNFKFTLRELGDLVGSLRSSIDTVVAVAGSAFSGIFAFFTVLVLSFYLLLDRDNLYKRVAWFTKDNRHLKMAKDFVDQVEDKLGGWVRGQSILMLLIGVITYLGLSLFSVPFALPLALLAGLLEVLPNLGPTVAAIPAIALAYLSGGPLMAGVITLFYIIVQQLENNVIVPKIMQSNADVSPLATIVIILIGLKTAGVIGALLSVPVYIVVRTLYYMWLQSHKH